MLSHAITRMRVMRISLLCDNMSQAQRSGRGKLVAREVVRADPGSVTFHGSSRQPGSGFVHFLN
jgi:hypothetical protein